MTKKELAEEVKVDELEGTQLDYWVAKAEGIEYREVNYSSYIATMDTLQTATIIDWNFIGKIIERDRIRLLLPSDYWEDTPFSMEGMADDAKYLSVYKAIIYDQIDSIQGWGIDKNPLTAIKRCIVKRKYGEYVNESR